MTRREFIKGATATAISVAVASSMAFCASEPLADYSIEKYCADVEALGLNETWRKINAFLTLDVPHGKFWEDADIGELYEMGLALSDKDKKKASGQYFTPPDVAHVMAKWLDALHGENVCDVACGTGNLILSYFNVVGDNHAKSLMKAGRIWLYDLDPLALDVCRAVLTMKYGKECAEAVHFVEADFLDAGTRLPKGCRVISNPPYANVSRLGDSWEDTPVANDTHELYAIFMDKILRFSDSSVIITPYSFLGGNKFYSLRREMNSCTGFSVSFDNVPGNIFRGRKHGIFNTNHSNSVRAAITVTNGRTALGYRISPLIRFKHEEREALLRNGVLEDMLNENRQIVTRSTPKYWKCDRRLDPIRQAWFAKKTSSFFQHVGSAGRFAISIPNVCRYFTSCSPNRLNRSGQMSFNVDDESVFNYLYCFLNSSFAYWHWRLYDGGITFSKGLLLEMPVFPELCSADDNRFFAETAAAMIAIEKDHIVKKENVGTQENIKFPRVWRDRINARLLKILDLDVDAKILDIVHSNMALRVNV